MKNKFLIEFRDRNKILPFLLLFGRWGPFPTFYILFYSLLIMVCKIFNFNLWLFYKENQINT